MRATPDSQAPVLAVLLDGTVATGEAFVLTEPSVDRNEAGAGWYRLSAPVAGWADSRWLLDAGVPDCSYQSLIAPSSRP